MIALIQRVIEASVEVEGRPLARIGPGILALVGVRRGDDAATAQRLGVRILSYRIFPDETGRMNRSLADIAGQLLVVPQFTLAADTRSGTRAGFGHAAEPQAARALFDALVARARQALPQVETGEFGAHMRLSLVNDGPVTFWLEA